MARPRELYNTPAPQAMSMMGQGIADAYARAGEIEGKGMMALGQGIAQGLTSAASSIAGAYGDYKKMQSQIKSSEGFYNTLKEGGYLPPELAKGIDTTVNSEVYKNMGTAEKAQFWNQATNFTGNAIGQFYKMQQIKAEVAGRALGAQKPPMLNNPDDIFGSIFSGTPVAPKTPAAVVPVDQSMQGQDTTQPATDLAEFLRRKGWSGRGPVPEALMREFNASQPFSNPY